MARKTREEGNLPCDLHWRTTHKGRDYVMRTIFEKQKGDLDISKAHRDLWFTNGWEKRYDQLVKKQRRMGISDNIFHRKKSKV